MNKNSVVNIHHIKTTGLILRWQYFKLTDLTDFLVVAISSLTIVPQNSNVFLWIYRPMYGTDLFIVNGAERTYLNY